MHGFRALEFLNFIFKFCVCTCAHVCMCTHTCGNQKVTLSVTLQGLSTLSSEAGSLTDLQLIKKAFVPGDLISTFSALGFFVFLKQNDALRDVSRKSKRNSPQFCFHLGRNWKWLRTTPTLLVQKCGQRGSAHDIWSG